MLYKYLDPDRINILESGLIRFTQPSDFNDPFEFKPVASTLASKAEIDKYVDQYMDEILQVELKKYPLEVRTLIPLKQLKLITRQLYSQNLPEIEKKLVEMGSATTQLFSDKSNELIGVLSLTENNSNLLMWSHYARSHKGFCVGFDKKSDFFNQTRSRKDEFYHLRKVEYCKDRPISRLTQLSGVELLLIKSEAWQYEQEWRMCAALTDSSSSFTTDENPLPIHLFEFPKTAVKEIILGACISQDNKDKLLGIIKTNEEYNHVAVKQAIISSKQFKLEFIDL
ncbi:DUF2971 domain-containing protein [Shewanella litoralis]|uniref:DUF2971 domain-containing protein n=1 Tax=Shewanella litoralis TaxID=2282700 RepID=A0ABQ2RM14_9GAMM|nr:DUF2971 domain-containing protein [Shewanella litoralis]GGQ32381.1 hypothetical protein GCM10009411_34900 [Shewanella litoralis]